MKSLHRALLTTALAVAALGGLEARGLHDASADDSGLSTSAPAPSPYDYARPAAPPPVRKGRAGFGERTRELGARVVLLDEPVPKASPPVPLAADLAEQTLGMGLSSEPALAASLVGLGCLLGWRSRRKLARRGAWASGAAAGPVRLSR